MFNKLLSYLYKLSEKDWHHSLFIYGLYISYFLAFIAFTGVLSFSPQYLNILRSIIHYYIIFMLLIRFNPLISKTNMNCKNDREIIFSAALFLLVSSSLFDYLEQFIIPIIKK